MSGIYQVQGRIFRPWKNGGGETAEIAIWPLSASIETFSWRVSTAWVASSGPFSSFPGINRVLTVIEGGPMALEIGGNAHHLDKSSPPLAFPGDVPVMARLDGPPLLDFNVMTRRPLETEVARGTEALFPDARLALLLEPGAGLDRLDLVDLGARPELAPALAGTRAIRVRFR